MIEEISALSVDPVDPVNPVARSRGPGASSAGKASRIHSLYGMRVRSAIPLPCPVWQGAEDVADVHLVECTDQDLREACVSLPIHSEGDGFWECRQFADGAARISWKDHFEFFVSGDGSRVLWRRLVGVPDEVLFTYLLNQVLSYSLVARGMEPLHATAVVVGGKAIALLGDTGFGKSTLAAEFLRRGYPLLTDDLLVLEFAGTGVVAHPSLARLKLHPGSAGTAIEQRRALPMNSFTTKMIVPLHDSEHVARPVPLRTLFVMPSSVGSARISIRRARGHRSLIPLITNSFNASLLTPRRLKQQFEFAGRLATSVPIKFLSYPRRMELLPAVADSILANLERDPGPR